MRTSDDDFKEFKAELDYLLVLWGLVGWEATVRHHHIDNETVAQTQADPVNRMVVFTLNTKWGGIEFDINLKEIALHETLELLVWKLKALVPDHLQDQATEEVHKIIQTITNVLRCIKNEQKETDNH